MRGMRFWVWAAFTALLIAQQDGVLGSQQPDANQPGLGMVKLEGDSRADKIGIEGEGPAATYEAEQAAIRAYPGDSIPPDATFNARLAFQSIKTGGNAFAQWSPIGPLSEARYPGVLDVFLFDGAEYVASGRVTALAIAPSCTESRCRLYAGAAGGGIWLTDKALGKDAAWSFVTGSLESNAIGSILLDPNDPSGNTLYVGTGEPNASVDSEAGVGIYKSTDGGHTWSLVPGSGIFYQRAVSSLAFDKDGNLLVGVASAVRGISSTDGGASSSASTTHPLVTRGVWRQTGSTFTLLRGTFIRGTTEVGLFPGPGFGGQQGFRITMSLSLMKNCTEH